MTYKLILTSESEEYLSFPTGRTIEFEFPEDIQWNGILEAFMTALPALGFPISNKKLQKIMALADHEAYVI